MRKLKKSLLAVCASAIMIGAMPVTASAYWFELEMPSYFVGGMRSTELNKKTSSSTPYVDPDIATLNTAYFLSPYRLNRTNATNVVSISNGARRTFSWQSGQGSQGSLYCLSAYPNVNAATWDAYNTRGTWGN